MTLVERLYTTRRPHEERPTPPVAVRRVAAVLAVGLYPLSLLLVSADIEVLAGLGTPTYVVLAVLVTGVWIWSFFVVYEFRRRLAQAPDDQLDERERTVRDEAYLISYRLLSAAMAALAVWALAIVPAVNGNRQVSLDTLLDVFFTLVIAAVVVPSAVVAWRDTGDDLGDDDEPEAVPSTPARGRP